MTWSVLKAKSKSHRNGLRAWRRDERGVSAVEFALILPIMITMYIGAVEFSHALTLDRRVTSIASAASDLVAQSKEMTNGEIDDIFEASTSIMIPYTAAPVKIVLTSIIADENNDTTVDWSCAHNDSPRSQGSAITVPTGVTAPFSSVILAEVSYTYVPTVSQFLTGGVTMTDSFYLRPRRSLTVEKTDAGCP